MPKLIAANWKENPRTEAQALALFQAVAKTRRDGGVRVRGVEVAICPPFIYLEEIVGAFKKLNATARKGLSLGAQDVFWEERGPFTSEVGPKMLRSMGIRYVIVGHSERRTWLKETDAMVNKKIRLALADGLRVILCVGEGLPVRKKGLAAARAFVGAQIRKGLAGVARLKPGKGSIVVAYEPIWSIGTGRYDNAEDAAEMANVIKAAVKKTCKVTDVPVLYGGSVNSRNIADYVQYKEIGGALVGGASLKAVEFKKIIINTSKK